MASNRKFYEIDVTVMFNGATCNSLDVTFEKPTECANIRCEYTNGKILVEIPNDCSECVYANVICSDDDCAVCEDTQRVKICPCDSSADCPSCEGCVNSLCVSECADGEFCSAEEICVECDDNTPCDNNQVCVSGKCECPPENPILNDKGICVACDNANPCPDCTYCTPDGCKPVVCPSGVCNPETGDCVECNGSGDCDGENECCVGNKCDCCTGFKRDYATGKCVPDDECRGDIDCDDCEICYLGKCIPKECPKGYICVKGDCKKECDCEDATCSKSAACVAADANRCYCKECEGDCSENSDCGEGCYCDNGTCKPNPCKGSCTDGSECGDGCGCDPTTGECVPCNSKSCDNDDCEKVLGCGCLGTGCEDIGGCVGGCSSSHDCGEGCTCHEGECTPCADFSCEDCVDRPGCACNGTKCEGDGLGEEGCSDDFKITKDDANCDLIATLVKDEDCSCPKLTINTKLSDVTFGSDKYFLDLMVQLRKGSVDSVSAVDTLPLLGDESKEYIAENEKPYSGLIEVFITTTYKEVDTDGIFVKFTDGPVDKRSISVVDKDSVTFQDVAVPAIGSKFNDLLTVYKVSVEVRQATDLLFPNNCDYKAPKSVDKFTISSNDDLEAIFGGNQLKKLDFAGYTTIKSSSKRHPMFIWYKSTDGSYSPDEIFRKVYKHPETDGTYSDTLFGMAQNPHGADVLEDPEGELWSNRYYSIKNDCSCDRDADLGKLIFCNPDELFYSLKDCNTKVELLEPFLPCDVNQDKTQWDVPHYTIPTDVQTKYVFYINGSEIGTFVHDKVLGMVKDGTSDSMFDLYDVGEPIKELKLVINHDDTDECTLIYPITSPDAVTINKTVNCDVTGPNYIVTVPKVGTGYEIDTITLTGGGTYVEGTSSFILTLPKSVTVTIEYALKDSCTKVETINEDCCKDFSVTLNATDVRCGEALTLTYSYVGGSAPYTSVFKGPDGNVIASVGEVLIITSPASGTYTVEVTDANSCTAKDTEQVTVIGEPVLTFSEYTDICPGSSTKIKIETDAAGVGGTLNYNNTSILMDTSVKYIDPINTAGVYSFISIEVDGCTYSIGEVVEIAVLSEYNVVVTNPDLSACLNSETYFDVTGAPVGCTIGLYLNGAIVSSEIIGAGGTTTLVDDVSTNSVYVVDMVTCDAECVSGLPISFNVSAFAGTPITVTSETCDVTLTNKTITFDYIDSAVDQDGNAITVTGNSIIVNPNLITSTTVTYNDGTCTNNETFQILTCDCPDVTITLDDVVINSGESTTLTPVITGGSGSYNYDWSTNEVTSSITVTPTTTTTYTLTLTDNINNCIYVKTVTVIVVSCTGNLDAITFIGCVCDGGDCYLTFTPTFTTDYLSCKVNEGLSTVEAFIDGSMTPTAVDISNVNKLDFIISLPDGAGCPDPTTVRFAGDVIFLDETGDSCCDGTTLSINSTVSRPGGAGWACTGC